MNQYIFYIITYIIHIATVPLCKIYYYCVISYNSEEKFIREFDLDYIIIITMYINHFIYPYN